MQRRRASVMGGGLSRKSSLKQMKKEMRNVKQGQECGVILADFAGTAPGDTLTCTATASDTDGGTPTLTYAWSGSSSGSLGSSDTVDLSATAAVSSETITCTATATDTAAAGPTDWHQLGR